MARAYSKRESAERLSVSVEAVEIYKDRGMQKLGLKTQVDIVEYGIRRGWLEQG
jgi:DNA-binding CsgD family transcriptional regulator